MMKSDITRQHGQKLQRHRSPVVLDAGKGKAFLRESATRQSTHQCFTHNHRKKQGSKDLCPSEFIAYSLEWDSSSTVETAGKQIRTDDHARTLQGPAQLSLLFP